MVIKEECDIRMGGATLELEVALAPLQTSKIKFHIVSNLNYPLDILSIHIKYFFSSFINV